MTRLSGGNGEEQLELGEATLRRRALQWILTLNIQIKKVKKPPMREDTSILDKICNKLNIEI